MARPTKLRFEHHEPGRLGIGERRPRLSWQVIDAEADYTQLAYRLEVAIDDGDPETFDVDGRDQILVPWPAPPLGSRQRVQARVQVRHADTWSEWSTLAVTETGLLSHDDWHAGFVGARPHPAESGTLRRPTRIRRRFSLSADVARARAYVTAHGLIELEINGRRVGNEALTPGWTSYDHRLRYATFDVTDFLTAGENIVGAWLGDGWWRGRIGFVGATDYYGTDQSALIQIEMATIDGETVTIASDESWSVAESPIIASGLYEGEEFDARLHDKDWSRAGTSDEKWRPAEVVAAAPDTLVEPLGPPVRATEELLPVAISDKGDGRFLLDFGQNHTGRLRIRVDGREADTVVIRHAEVLQDDELYVRTLRTAQSTDVYHLRGDGPEEWEPRFTMHGYRYAEISGWPGALRPGDIVSRVYHSDMTRTGWFRSSRPDLEQLHENVVWSLRSNFVDLPTDCPQRDERLGWTGDIQVFAPTAAFLYDVTGMLSSWLQDVAAEQQALGSVPFYVPFIDRPGQDPITDTPRAVWDDVVVLTPDALYESTADTGLLEHQYASAKALIDHYENAAGAALSLAGTFQFADWLDPGAPPENPFLALTEPALVAEAYFAHSARRLAAIATLLGRTAEAVRYKSLADLVAETFSARYVVDEGLLTSDTQTAYSLAIVFDLYTTPEHAARGGERLAELVRLAEGRIATGFAGTAVVSDALTRCGHLDEAYLLLATDALPSWLYPVSRGATTVWERWDSMLPDGSINPGEMTSFNHYALGAVASWLHRVVAGLDAAEPGYRTIRFAPRPGGGLRSAGASHETPYGVAEIDWTLDDAGSMTIRMLVPAGTSAVLSLVDGEDRPVKPGESTVIVHLSPTR